jgi:hypothetical protein
MDCRDRDRSNPRVKAGLAEAAAPSRARTLGALRRGGAFRGWRGNGPARAPAAAECGNRVTWTRASTRHRTSTDHPAQLLERQQTQRAWRRTSPEGRRGHRAARRWARASPAPAPPCAAPTRLLKPFNPIIHLARRADVFPPLRRRVAPFGRSSLNLATPRSPRGGFFIGDGRRRCFSAPSADLPCRRR